MLMEIGDWRLGNLLNKRSPLAPLKKGGTRDSSTLTFPLKRGTRDSSTLTFPLKRGTRDSSTLTFPLKGGNKIFLNVNISSKRGEQDISQR
jgi:hypothetical protein